MFLKPRLQEVLGLVGVDWAVVVLKAAAASLDD